MSLAAEFKKQQCLLLRRVSDHYLRYSYDHKEVEALCLSDNNLRDGQEQDHHSKNLLRDALR
jgi:hypothetical protein